MKERPVIIVAGKMPNMQSWYEEKCRRALEELSLLAGIFSKKYPAGGDRAATRLHLQVRLREGRNP